jgi:hypothetical protein
MTVLKGTKEELFAAFSVSTAAFFMSQRILQVKKRTSLARPLLILNRYETKRLCQIWGLPVYPDQTNKELLFSRNRVRKQLMPMLRSFFNPQIDVVLSHLSEALLLEQLCTEFRFVKLSRTAKHCHLLWPTYTILQFWQTRPLVKQHHVQIGLPKACGRPRKEAAKKPNLLIGGRPPTAYRFSAHRNTTLHKELASQNTRFGRFGVFCVRSSLKDEGLSQFGAPHREWWLHCKIQENRSLSARAAPASLIQTCRAAGDRNVLSIQMVSQASRILFEKHKIPDSEGSHRLRERVALSMYCTEHIFADRLFSIHEIIPPCQLAASWLWGFSLRHQYYYFPKAGCLIKLGKTLPVRRPSLKMESTV